MASSSSNFASFANGTRSAGNPAWASPIAGGTSNAAYASLNLGGAGLGSDISQYLKATNPTGLTIPSGATINGIAFSVERMYSDPFASGRTALDKEIYIIKGGTIQTGQNKASVSVWPLDTDAVATYGGVADLWGLTWVDTDFGVGFGLAVSAKEDTYTDEQSVEAYIDYVSCQVYYTAASAGVVSASGRCRLMTGVG